MKDETMDADGCLMFGRKVTSVSCEVPSSDTRDSFEGHAAQFAVFSHGLSSSEIDALFLAAPSGLEDGLILAWLNAAEGPAPDSDVDELMNRDEWRLGFGRGPVHMVWRDVLRRNDGEFVGTTSESRMPHWVHPANIMAGAFDGYYAYLAHTSSHFSRP